MTVRNISRFVLPGLLLLLVGCEDRPQQIYQWQHSEGSYAATFSADGIRGQRIDCAWYFNEISGLHYDLYIFPKLMLAMDLVINHPVLHDTSR